MPVIETEEELDEALKQVDRYFSQHTLSPAEEQELDALADAIEAYEDIHYPIDPPEAGVTYEE